MKSSAICALLFTLGLVLISHATLHAEANKVKGRKLPLAVSLCKGLYLEEYRANCMRAVASDPNVLKAKNYLQLAQAVIAIAEKKGLEGEKFLKGLATSNNSKAIEECASNYGYLARSFKSALVSLSAKWSDNDKLIEYVNGLSYDMHVTYAEITYCKSWLEDAHIVNPAISALNSEMGFFCGIASDVTDQYESFLRGYDI